MARDTRKRVYRLVGLPRGQVFDRYQQEADGVGMSVPAYLEALLIDRLEALDGHGQGRWFPRGGTVIVQKEQPLKSDQVDEEEMLTNAARARSAWAGEDED